MTTPAFPKASPNATNNSLANNKDLLAFWYQPWAETTNSAVKLHCIWLETVNDAFRHEVDFLATIAPVYNKLTRCMLGFNGPLTPETMASCYHQIAGDMREATFNRMRTVSELSEDFKERIWCEL